MKPNPMQAYAEGGLTARNVLARELPPTQRAWVEKDPKGYPRADNPASFVQDEAAWEKAKEIVRPRWDDYDQPWAVVTSIYSKLAK